MVKEFNRFCEQQRKLNNDHWISGHPWSHDLTLPELMTFMSILIEMTLHPTPGRAYTYMWMNAILYPFMKAISVTRFRQIRSIIHLCGNESDSGKNKDADPLSKKRPLLQILKETLPIYLNSGDNLALDEASVASKSKFGRFLIMYNPMKPGGKTAPSVMVPPGKDDAVPTGSETVDYGYQSEQPIVDTVFNEEEGKITKLLLDSQHGPFL
eukprot:scaffold38209_cov55-Attheya_sp.AAC.3